MKKLPLMLVCLILATCTLHIHAKKETVQKMYMFGLSASFKDSVVYITDIQEVKDVWYDTKTKFLLGRENYSSQLSQYLTEQKNQHRDVQSRQEETRQEAEHNETTLHREIKREV